MLSRLIFCLLAVALASPTLAATFSADADDSTVPADVATWLEAYVASRETFEGGIVHYPHHGAHFVEGDLGNRPAGLLLFGLEQIRGGTDWLQYLVVFWKRHGQFVFCCVRRVGGKAYRSVEEFDFSDRGVRLTGKTWVSGKDAMCCPSKPFEVYLTVKDSMLAEGS
jgi:hypothetical protein